MTKSTKERSPSPACYCQFLLTKLEHFPERPLVCPHATTVVAYSTYFKSRIVMARECGRWGCRYCGTRKCVALAHRVKDANPTKFVTLTVNNAIYADARSAYNLTRRRISDLSKLIRKRFLEWEYVRVLEITKKGWPHYHLLARCPYIPQSWISDRWNELTGAPIVDIRKIHQKTDIYRYVMKYLSKQKFIPWTDRRTSWSKFFFPPDEKIPRGKWKIDSREWEDEHPYDWLNQHAYGHPCTPVAANAWLIDTIMPDSPAHPKYVEPTPKTSDQLTQSSQPLTLEYPCSLI